MIWDATSPSFFSGNVGCWELRMLQIGLSALRSHVLLASDFIIWQRRIAWPKSV